MFQLDIYFYLRKILTLNLKGVFFGHNSVMTAKSNRYTVDPMSPPHQVDVSNTGSPSGKREVDSEFKFNNKYSFSGRMY